MKRFLISLFYFILPFIIAALIADYVLTASLKKSTVFAAGEYPTWNAIYGGDMNYDVAIYGSSRATVQIDPAIIARALNLTCYNFGMDGHNFWAQYFRHQEYIKYNTPPKLIVHSLDATTLSNRGDLFNAEQFLPYMLYDSSVATFLTNYRAFHFTDTHVPFLRYIGRPRAIQHGLKQFVSHNSSTGRKLGYEGQSLTWNGDLATAKKRMPSYHVPIDADCVRLFDSYLKSLHAQNIKIIFVYSPEYIEGQSFISNRNEIMDYYKHISIRYGIPFLDYSMDSISLDQSNFYNTGHLNKQGAEKFTNQLVRDLKDLASIRDLN